MFPVPLSPPAPACALTPAHHHKLLDQNGRHIRQSQSKPAASTMETPRSSSASCSSPPHPTPRCRLSAEKRGVVHSRLAITYEAEQPQLVAVLPDVGHLGGARHPIDEPGKGRWKTAFPSSIAQPERAAHAPISAGARRFNNENAHRGSPVLAVPAAGAVVSPQLIRPHKLCARTDSTREAGKRRWQKALAHSSGGCAQPAVHGPGSHRTAPPAPPRCGTRSCPRRRQPPASTPLRAPEHPVGQRIFPVELSHRICATYFPPLVRPLASPPPLYSVDPAGRGVWADAVFPTPVWSQHRRTELAGSRGPWGAISILPTGYRGAVAPRDASRPAAP
jgi:hypothetical protein